MTNAGQQDLEEIRLLTMLQSIDVAAQGGQSDRQPKFSTAPQ
jgi:hypothetical protein